MAKSKPRGRPASSKVKTRAGNNVVSWAEATLDNWLYTHGFDFIYEPEIELVDEIFKPDWIVYGKGGWKFEYPIIIEYWGLLRTENRAKWLIDRLPTYIERKNYKEKFYHRSEDFLYFGVDPSQARNITEQMKENLTLAIERQFYDISIS
jgi:hypothetical protein